MEERMIAISLGWGVQSFGLAAMSALGVLPPVDVAIHADTTHERRETYEFAARWTPWLEERGVRVVVVVDHLAPTDIPDPERPVILPAFTLCHDGARPGVLRRSCTWRLKVQPIKRYLQAHRNGEQVEQWIGITLDEVTRMRQSDVKYQVLRYPFIEYLSRPWTRTMAMQWLQENGLEIPVKSSCVFCPYHDRATWREIKQGGNGDWEKAVEVDRAIRDKRPGYRCYLTAARIPLDEVDLRNEEDHGQLTLWDEECSGMCFL